MFTYIINEDKILIILDDNGIEVDRFGPWSQLEGIDLWASGFVDQINEYGGYPLPDKD
jgi:hypothetical protein